MAMNVVGRVRAVPPTLIAMYRVLRSKRGSSGKVTVLFEELLPPAVRTKEEFDPVQQTLALGEDLDLWGRNASGDEVSLSEAGSNLDLDGLRTHVGRRMLCGERADVDLKFMLTLAWVLAQDGLWAEPCSAQAAEDLLQGQIQGDSFRFNNNEFAQMYHWAGWLGAVEIETLGASSVVRADPTRLLERWIREDGVLRKKLPVEEFLRALAERYPFLDDGWVLADLQVSCPHLKRDREGLSPSLSFALLRLENAGVLSLGAPSDAPGRLLEVGGRRRKVCLVEEGRAS